MNNLYGCSMSEPLPIRNFIWSKVEIQSVNLCNLDDNAKLTADQSQFLKCVKTGTDVEDNKRDEVLSGVRAID